MRLLVSLMLVGAIYAQKLPDLYKQEMHGDAPYLSQPGWRPLLNGIDLTGWVGEHGAKHEWVAAKSVNWKRIFNPKGLDYSAAPGDRMTNGKLGKTIDIETVEKFGDFELYLEYVLPRGSNSGVFLHALYEIQLFDSYGHAGLLQVGDNGGIYAYPDGLGGAPPLLNASRPAGDWQSLQVWFRAPRFDAAGKKTGNARILRVLLNDTLVQREYELAGPTGSSGWGPEAATNPIRLQGDHGPVAFRNMYVRELK